MKKGTRLYPYSILQRTIQAVYRDKLFTRDKLPDVIIRDFSRAWKIVSKTQKNIWNTFAKQVKDGDLVISDLTQYITIGDGEEPITILNHLLMVSPRVSK